MEPRTSGAGNIPKGPSLKGGRKRTRQNKRKRTRHTRRFKRR